MNLIVTAKQMKGHDLVIDYIEIKLPDGKEISLNWTGSSYERGLDGKLAARLTGVCFGEEDANGRLDEILGFRVTKIGHYDTYTEEEGEDCILLETMEFADGNDIYEVNHPYSEGADPAKLKIRHPEEALRRQKVTMMQIMKNLTTTREGNPFWTDGTAIFCENDYEAHAVADFLESMGLNVMSGTVDTPNGYCYVT